MKAGKNILKKWIILPRSPLWLMSGQYILNSICMVMGGIASN